MGPKNMRLKPVGGLCAETGGATTLFLATGLGVPVSTPHTITGAIVGVDSAQKFSAVRCGVAGISCGRGYLILRARRMFLRSHDGLRNITCEAELGSHLGREPDDFPAA